MYIGREPQIGNYQICDAISVVNGQAAYTMQVGSVNVNPESAINTIVSLNGTIQKANSSYTIANSVITFSSNLVTGDVIDFILILGSTLDLGVPSDNTVSTAKIVDDAVTAAKINNDIISGSTELATAPADTDEFLVSDAGTLKRIDYSLIKSSAGLTKLSTTTVSSSVAAAEFTSGIDSTYKLYRLVGQDVQTVDDDVNLEIEFSSDGGSSYITSGYDTVINRLAAEFNNVVTATGAAMDLNNIGNSTNENGYFDFYFVDPSNSSTFTAYYFNAVTRNNDARVVHFNGGGMYEATTALNALRIKGAAGNIDKGTFILYGVNS